MQKILENLAATAELMGQAISPTAIAIMAQDLSEYPQDMVLKALTQVRRESKFKLTLAAIIEQIEKLNPDGRPGADEAWAMIPRDEATSAVMTVEMAEAMGVAQPLLDEGDQVAARMAFKAVYERIVDANKRNGVNQKWFASIGHDKGGREAVLAEAVRLGRIGAQHAIGLIAPDRVADMLDMAGEQKLALEHKPVSIEQAHAHLARLKAMIHVKAI